MSRTKEIAYVYDHLRASKLTGNECHLDLNGDRVTYISDENGAEGIHLTMCGYRFDRVIIEPGAVMRTQPLSWLVSRLYDVRKEDGKVFFACDFHRELLKVDFYDKYNVMKDTIGVDELHLRKKIGFYRSALGIEVGEDLIADPYKVQVTENIRVLEARSSDTIHIVQKNDGFPAEVIMFESKDLDKLINALQHMKVALKYGKARYEPQEVGHPQGPTVY